MRFEFKYLFLGFCLVFGQVQAGGDQKNRSHFAEIMVGPAFPLGTFGKSEFFSEKAGNANTGHAFLFTYGKVFNERYGYEIALSTYFNPTAGNLDYSFEDWVNWNLLVGPFLTIPLTPELNMDLRALVGVMFTKRPRISGIDLQNQNIISPYYTEGDDGYSFSPQLGFGLRHKLSRMIDFKLAADLTFANPKVKYITIYDDGVFIRYIVSNHEHLQPINITTITVGLVLHSK